MEKQNSLGAGLHLVIGSRMDWYNMFNNLLIILQFWNNHLHTMQMMQTLCIVVIICANGLLTMSEQLQIIFENWTARGCHHRPLYWSELAVQEMPSRCAQRISGKMGHFRWLTVAETSIDIWRSEHGLEGEFRTLVTFIVSVYCPMWFLIKVKHSWLEGPSWVSTACSLTKFRRSSSQPCWDQPGTVNDL
jgi:hypothetical protein